MFDMSGWYWLASVECVASNHSTQLHAEQASKVHNREKGTFSERYDQDFSDAQKGTGVFGKANAKVTPDILGISLGYLGDILGVFWRYLGDILGMSSGYLRGILGISWG